MKIKLTKDVLVKGAHKKDGEVVELDEQNARYFMGRGFAIEAKAEKKDGKK